jgi:hypothetical protein
MTAGPPPRPSTARLSTPPVAARRGMARPRVVVVSVWLWWLAAALAVLTVVSAAARLDAVRAELASAVLATDAEATPEVVDRVVDASVLVLVVGGLVIGIACLSLLPRMRAGRGWARVALTAVAVVAVAYGVLVVSVTGWVVLACAAAATAATVCTYLPGSGRWFA